MNIPADLKYTKDHEWVKVDGDEATIGVTDYAQGELGDVVYVEIETEGESLDQGRGVRNSGGSEDSVRSVHAAERRSCGCKCKTLTDAPDTVNTDPYGEGWMVKVKMSDASQVDSVCLSADDYKRRSRSVICF